MLIAKDLEFFEWKNQLNGEVFVVDGKLDVNGAGTDATGWAVTDSETGQYTGPRIEDKTLVSWLTLESLADGARSGSAITIDARPTKPLFQPWNRSA